MRGAPREDADDEDAVQALMAVGVPEALARERVGGQFDAAEGAAPAAADVPVLRENWAAVRVFVAMGTQWRYRPAGMGSVPAGLEYAALPGVMGLVGVKRRRRGRVFEQVRVMEAVALEAMRGR